MRILRSSLSSFPLPFPLFPSPFFLFPSSLSLFPPGGPRRASGPVQHFLGGLRPRGVTVLTRRSVGGLHEGFPGARRGAEAGPAGGTVTWGRPERPGLGGPASHDHGPPSITGPTRRPTWTRGKPVPGRPKPSQAQADGAGITLLTRRSPPASRPGGPRASGGL